MHHTVPKIVCRKRHAQSPMITFLTTRSPVLWLVFAACTFVFCMPRTRPEDLTTHQIMDDLKQHLRCSRNPTLDTPPLPIPYNTHVIIITTHLIFGTILHAHTHLLGHHRKTQHVVIEILSIWYCPHTRTHHQTNEGANCGRYLTPLQYP
jgi:hypothetical protein